MKAPKVLLLQPWHALLWLHVFFMNVHPEGREKRTLWLLLSRDSIWKMVGKWQGRLNFGDSGKATCRAEQAVLPLHGLHTIQVIHKQVSHLPPPGDPCAIKWTGF